MSLVRQRSPADRAAPGPDGGGHGEGLLVSRPGHQSGRADISGDAVEGDWERGWSPGRVWLSKCLQVYSNDVNHRAVANPTTVAKPA